MARTVRMALDVALVSMKIVRPIVSKAWLTTKSKLNGTRANVIFENAMIAKLENTLGSVANILDTKLTSLRDQQLPLEKDYLERQLEIVKRKLGERKPGNAIPECTNNKSAASKFGHYHGSIAWAYFKVEGVPPMTQAIFNGAVGNQIENVVGGAVKSVIGIIESSIKNIDDNEAKAKRDRELALIAAQEAAKAAEQKKKNDAAQAKIAKEKKVEAKKAEKESEKKKADEKKPDQKKDPPKSEKKK